MLHLYLLQGLEDVHTCTKIIVFYSAIGSCVGITMFQKLKINAIYVKFILNT